MLKRKQMSVPLDLKIKLLSEVDNQKQTGLTITQICAKYGIPKSTFSCILSKRKLIEEAHGQFSPDRKRVRKAAYEQIDTALWNWIKQTENKLSEISGPALMEKASELAKEMNIEFTADADWLSDFKTRRALMLNSSAYDLDKAHEKNPTPVKLMREIGEEQRLSEMDKIYTPEVTNSYLVEMKGQIDYEAQEQPEEVEVEEQMLNEIETCKTHIPDATHLCLVERKGQIDQAYAQSPIGSLVGPGSKKNRESAYTYDKNIDAALWNWIKESGDKFLVLSGPVLMDKANKLAEEMNIDFTADAKWLSDFKKRTAENFRTINSEAYSMLKDAAEACADVDLEPTAAERKGQIDQAYAQSPIGSLVSPGSKKNRESAYTYYKNIDAALWNWIKESGDKFLVLSGPVLMNKANKLAEEMNIDFTADAKWLSDFKKRTAENFRTINSEAYSMLKDAAEACADVDLEPTAAEDIPVDIVKIEKTEEHYETDYLMPISSADTSEEAVEGYDASEAWAVEDIEPITADGISDVIVEIKKERVTNDTEYLTPSSSAVAAKEVTEDYHYDAAEAWTIEDIDPTTVENVSSDVVVQTENAEECDEAEYKIPISPAVTAEKAMDAIDIVQRFFESQRDSENILKLLTEIRAFVKETTLKRPRQTVITDFFI